MNEHLSHFKEDIHLLLEAGFIAINQADEDSSKKLFHAAELIDPKNVLVWVGKGYLCLHKLDTVSAKKWFEKALTIDPENQMANAFLGLSYLFTPNGVGKGEKICLDSIQHTTDPQVKKFAESALEFSHSFIKKSYRKESPMGLHKKAPTHKKTPPKKKK